MSSPILNLSYVSETDPEVLRESAKHLTDTLIAAGDQDITTLHPWVQMVETRDHMLEIAEAIEDGRMQGLPRMPKARR